MIFVVVVAVVIAYLCYIFESFFIYVLSFSCISLVNDGFLTELSDFLLRLSTTFRLPESMMVRVKKN